MGGRTPTQEVATVRLPKATDPALRQAQMRAQQAATNRTGRTSTMLSDAIRSITGSAGKLGA